jgi:hypothetical protein
MARRPLQLLTLTAAAALITSCSSTAPATHPSTTPTTAATSPTRPAPPASPPPATRTTAATQPGDTPAPAATPDDIAQAAARAWLSYDTRIDHRPSDTARRLALPLLTPAFRAQTLAFTPAAAPGAEWDDWTSRHAYAIVSTRLGGDDHPPDTPAAAWRQITATITLHGDQSWTAIQQQTQFLQLTHTAQGWRVAQLTAAHGT